MARRLFRKYLPHPERLRWLGPLAHRPDLWHLNRHSTARAFAVGCFWGFIPIPLQTIPTVVTAAAGRANVPLSWGVTWLINPLFIPWYIYPAYTLGRVILRRPAIEVPFEWESAGRHLPEIGAWAVGHVWDVGLPILLGCLLLATVSAAASYLAVQWFWTRYTWRRWRRHAHERFPARVVKEKTPRSRITVRAKAG